MPKNLLTLGILGVAIVFLFLSGQSRYRSYVATETQTIVTLTIDCQTLSFDVAERLYQQRPNDKAAAECFLAAAWTLENVERVASLTSGRRLVDASEARERMTIKLLADVYDCKSAREATKIIISRSLYEQALTKVVAYCDGTRLLKEDRKKGGQ